MFNQWKEKWCILKQYSSFLIDNKKLFDIFREVLEETGYDISDKIDPEVFIGKLYLFVVRFGETLFCNKY